MREDFLFRYTTLGVGGKTRILVAEKPEELCECNSVILGGGSNVLAGERNLPDFIINRVEGAEFSAEKVTAYSGEKLNRICARATLSGLGGLEWAWGLPGTLGGAIVGNAGANGSDISSLVNSVTVFRSGSVINLTREECGFRYRGSGFLPGDVIISAQLNLLKRHFSEIEKNLKKAKQTRARQPKGKSAGCTFKNPPGLSMGKIIDQLGLKGQRIGGAKISEKHANFIVNDCGASSADVYELINLIEQKTESAFGFIPEREIKIYGDF